MIDVFNPGGSYTALVPGDSSDPVATANRAALIEMLAANEGVYFPSQTGLAGSSANTVWVSDGINSSDFATNNDMQNCFIRGDGIKQSSIRVSNTLGTDRPLFDFSSSTLYYFDVVVENIALWGNNNMSTAAIVAVGSGSRTYAITFRNVWFRYGDGKSLDGGDGFSSKGDSYQLIVFDNCGFTRCRGWGARISGLNTTFIAPRFEFNGANGTGGGLLVEKGTTPNYRNKSCVIVAPYLEDNRAPTYGEAAIVLDDVRGVEVIGPTVYKTDSTKIIFRNSAQGNTVRVGDVQEGDDIVCQFETGALQNFIEGTRAIPSGTHARYNYCGRNGLPNHQTYRPTAGVLDTIGRGSGLPIEYARNVTLEDAKDYVLDFEYSWVTQGSNVVQIQITRNSDGDTWNLPALAFLSGSHSSVLNTAEAGRIRWPFKTAGAGSYRYRIISYAYDDVSVMAIHNVAVVEET